MSEKKTAIAAGETTTEIETNNPSLGEAQEAALNTAVEENKEVIPSQSQRQYERDVERVLSPNDYPADGSNAAEMTEEEKLRSDIIDYYKPHRPVGEATADLKESLAMVNNLDNEIVGTALTRTAFDLADIGRHYIAVVDDKGRSSLSATPEMFKDLINLMKSANLLGTPDKFDQHDNSGLIKLVRPDPEKEGEQVEISSANRVVDTASPFTGKTLSYLNDSSMIACLLLLGHRTGVQVGYIRKTDSAGSHFSRNMVFLREDQINLEEVDQYHKAICVPTRVVCPCSYTPHYDAETKVNSLIIGEPSTNDTLRYLNKDWAFALYQHHFGGMALAYDLEARAPKQPTGMLLKQARAQRQTGGAVATADSNVPKSLDEARDMLRRERTQHAIEVANARSAALGEVDSGEFLRLLSSIAGMFADKNLAARIPAGAMSSGVEIGCNSVRRLVTRYEGKQLPHVIGRELVSLFETLQSCIEWSDEEAEWFWVDKNGNHINKIDDNKDHTYGPNNERQHKAA